MVASRITADMITLSELISDNYRHKNDHQGSQYDQIGKIALESATLLNENNPRSQSL